MAGKPVLPRSDLDPQLNHHGWQWDSPGWDWDDLFGGPGLGYGVFGDSLFGHDGLMPSGFRGGDTMTWLDAASFAKGGNSGGGGTGGGKPGGNVVTTYFAGAADGQLGYDIRIDFKGTGWTTDLQKAFKDTADYFTKVITQDIGGGGY